MKTKIRSIAVAVGVAALLALLHPVSALDYGGLGVRPANPDASVPNSASWFIYSLKTGEVKNDAVVVQNNTATPETLDVYAADSTPSSDGGFALKQEAESMTGVGSWVRFYPDNPPAPSVIGADGISGLCGFGVTPAAATKTTLTKAQSDALTTWCQGTAVVELTLGSMESKTIPFVITIPTTADVGEHSGGVVIQKKSAQDTTQQGSAVILTTRVGARIYETVPGSILRSLQLGAFSVVQNPKLPEMTVTVRVKNSGNVSVDHTTTVEITDTLLHRGDKKLVRDIQALPGEELVTNFAAPLPKIGRYTYRAVVTYNDGTTTKTLTSAMVTKWFIPWLELGIGAGVAVVLVVALVVVLRIRRKKYSGAGWVAYRVPADTNVMTLAEKSGIEWKMLARVNKLKAPYAVSKGSSLQVPSTSSLLVVKKHPTQKKKSVVATKKKTAPSAR